MLCSWVLKIVSADNYLELHLFLCYHLERYMTGSTQSNTKQTWNFFSLSRVPLFNKSIALNGLGLGEGVIKDSYF